MKIKIIITGLFCFFLILPAFAQKEKKGVILYNEKSIGARLHTMGWSIFGDIGKRLTVDKTKHYQVEISELKHYKEFKTPGNSYTPTPFIYGKQNNFFALRGSMGKRKIFAEKAEKSGVEASYIYQYGITLGILKPYYIMLQDNDERIKFDPEKPEEFLNRNNIKGGAGFLHGIGEIKPVPGLHGKVGLHFDWAGFSESVKALEVGAMLDVYPKKIPIMVNQSNSFFFTNLYLSFQIGKKY